MRHHVVQHVVEARYHAVGRRLVLVAGELRGADRCQKRKLDQAQRISRFVEPCRLRDATDFPASPEVKGTREERRRYQAASAPDVPSRSGVPASPEARSRERAYIHTHGALANEHRPPMPVALFRMGMRPSLHPWLTFDLGWVSCMGASPCGSKQPAQRASHFWSSLASPC